MISVMYEVIEFLCILVVCVIALGCGLFFFMLAASLISQNEGESRVKELESEYATRHLARNSRIIHELYQVGPPDLPSGHYSAQKEVHWAHIKQLQAEDEMLTKQERDHVISVECPVSDQEIEEVAAGINPYRRK